MTSQQFESKVVQNSSHVMPVPLQASQRYTLTEEGEVCGGNFVFWKIILHAN
jgi:hypothetical protein